MPISCDPNDLATAATCFSELSWRQRQQIRVYLLCTLVNGATPVECTPDALAAAATCYAKLSSGQLDQIETYLFCQLASTSPPFGPTIYSGNGTLAGDRTVNGGAHVLTIDNYTELLMTTTIGDLHGFVDLFNNYAVMQVQNNSTGDQTKVEVQDGQVLLSAAASGNGVKVGATGQKVGFLGATPLARIASADQAVATDPASTMALANALRAALIPTGGFGLIKGSA